MCQCCCNERLVEYKRWFFNRAHSGVEESTTTYASRGFGSEVEAKRALLKELTDANNGVAARKADIENVYRTEVQSAKRSRDMCLKSIKTHAARSAKIIRSLKKELGRA